MFAIQCGATGLRKEECLNNPDYTPCIRLHRAISSMMAATVPSLPSPTVPAIIFPNAPIHPANILAKIKECMQTATCWSTWRLRTWRSMSLHTRLTIFPSSSKPGEKPMEDPESRIPGNRGRAPQNSLHTARTTQPSWISSSIHILDFISPTPFEHQDWRARQFSQYHQQFHFLSEQQQTTTCQLGRNN